MAPEANRVSSTFGPQPFRRGGAGAGCHAASPTGDTSVLHEVWMPLFSPLPLLLVRAGVLERVSYLAVSRVSCDWTADDHHHSDVACVGVRGWGGRSTEV